MSDETYNGWKNRETWAFNLHWQNDYGMYKDTLERGHGALHDNPGASDRELGEAVVAYWRETLFDWDDESYGKLPDALVMFRDEVGSWWRIDYAETGACVRESLSNED